MAHATHESEAHEFNPVDPHGQHGRITHHTYSWQFLTAILLILLFLTFFTIFIAQLEIWIIESLAIPIPHWVNVVIAMGIATVKASLVLMFFMGLRRGNPVNVMIFLYTLFAFAMFLGFTALDLGGRGHIYEYKAHAIIEGGTGKSITPAGSDSELTVPITVYAKQKEIQRLQDEEGMTEEQAYAVWLEHYNEGHEHDHGPEHSTADQHVRRTGLTAGLFDFNAPSDDGAHHVSEGVADHSGDEHAEPATEYDTPAGHE